MLAGQSFGGYVTLEAIDTVQDIFAAIALSPGVRSSGADGRFDPTTVEQLLQHARVGRLALVFPKNDALFGNISRGARAQPILARREFPYLMVDETSEISGHGGGASGRFALRYGLCLADFLASPALPAGRFICPAPDDEWPVVRELLMRPGEKVSGLNVAPSALPAAVMPLVGLRWALLGDSPVLVAPVSDPGGVRLLYRSGGTNDGVYEATLGGGSIRAVLPNKSSVTLSAEGGNTITWTSPDRSTVLKAPLRRVVEP